MTAPPVPPKASVASSEPPRRNWRVNRRLLDFCRTVHIYLTMLGLLVLLLFGFTGFTLNHEDWFGAITPRINNTQGHVPAALAAKGDSRQLVEYVRQNFHVSGAMTNFNDEGDRSAIAFRSPGETWDIEVDKSTGQATIHTEAFNFIAVLDNLHRGQYTGAAWRFIIDVSAVLFVVACLTGLVLWLALPKRRRLGTVALALGTLGALLIYCFMVPGKDETTLPIITAAPANTTEPAAP